MTDTPRLGITQLEEDQALPEVVVNEGTRILEAFSNATHFISRTTTAQPGSPSDGDVYLLPASATGTDWAGHDGEIAIFVNTAWEFRDAKEGFIAWVDDDDEFIVFDGTNWIVTNAGSALDDLTDVNAPSPTAGQVLMWDDSNSEWIADDLPGAGAFVLDDATDVDAATPNDGDVLTWVDADNEWQALPAGAGGSGWTLVDSDTASASGTIDLSVDTATYNEWQLVGHDVVLSGANELALQLGSGVGPTWDTGNNYDFGAEWRYGTTSTGTHSRAFVSATSNIRLGTVASASSASGVPLDFECTLKYLASGKNARLINGTSSYDGSAGLTRILFDGVHLNAAYTTTGLRILPSAGTITSGKFLLYGRTR